jgi:capsular exopolysaccharide synthesis family protein
MTNDRESAQPLSRRSHTGVAAGGDWLEPSSGLPAFYDDGSDLQGNVTARRPRKLTMVVVFAVLASTALGAIWTLWTPTFQAKGVLEIRSLVPRLVVRTELTGPIPQYAQFLSSQVEILRNPTVFERVLGRSDVRNTAWFNEPPSAIDSLLRTPRDLLSRLQTALTAKALPGTELIEITAEAREPRDAVVLADALVDEYLKFSRERLSEEDRKLFAELTEEKDSLEHELSFSERIVAEARKDLRTASPDELIAQRRLRLGKLETSLEELDLEIALARKELEAADSPPASQPAGASANDHADNYRDDPEWRDLHAKYTEAQAAVAVAREQFGAAHPTMIELESKAQLRWTALREREAQLDRLTSMGLPMTATAPGQAALLKTPATLRQQLRQLEFRKELLQAHAQEVRNSFDHEFNTAESLRRHTDEQATYKTRLEAVQNRLYELDEKGRVPATIRPIGHATLPSSPQRDKRVKWSMAALVAAAGAALASAYLRALFSPQVYEAEDVLRSAHGVFLGYLPLERAPDFTTLERSPIQAEAIRMIRTALLARLNGTGACVVQITSAGEGTGKSTVATLLARSLAQSGKSVLLVDTDVHRPSLSGRFGIDASPGLLNILVDGTAEAHAIHKTNIPDLSVLPAGTWERGDELELLAQSAFSNLIDRWRKQYDIVLLDSPPLLATADAAILSRQANGTVLVTRERHCRRAAVIEALAMLSAAGGMLLGTVFLGSSRGSSYGYGYEYGYGYTQRHAPDAASSAADTP